MPRSDQAESGSLSKKPLSLDQCRDLLGALATRFEKNESRHRGLRWSEVQARLEADGDKLWSLHEMERTGGEPDVVGYDQTAGEYIFFDCSAETPEGPY